MEWVFSVRPTVSSGLNCHRRMVEMVGFRGTACFVPMHKCLHGRNSRPRDGQGTARQEKMDRAGSLLLELLQFIQMARYNSTYIGGRNASGHLVCDCCCRYGGTRLYVEAFYGKNASILEGDRLLRFYGARRMHECNFRRSFQ